MTIQLGNPYNMPGLDYFQIFISHFPRHSWEKIWNEHVTAQLQRMVSSMKPINMVCTYHLRCDEICDTAISGKFHPNMLSSTEVNVCDEAKWQVVYQT